MGVIHPSKPYHFSLSLRALYHAVINAVTDSAASVLDYAAIEKSALGLCLSCSHATQADKEASLFWCLDLSPCDHATASDEMRS
jgi:hypothetical protein